MAIWASMKIEKSSVGENDSFWPEYECDGGYDVVSDELDNLEELIEYLREATPGLRMERDTEILSRMGPRPPDENAIFRCWIEERPESSWYIAYFWLSCQCRHCQCDAPATQLDMYGNPVCDDCEEIGVDRLDRFCLRQTENGRLCPKCGDNIRWEAVREIQDPKAEVKRIQAGTCGCERREWRRTWGFEPDEPFLGVKELLVLKWEEVQQQNRDPKGRTDQEWRSGYPRAEYVCSQGVPLLLGVGFKLVHFQSDYGSTHEPSWYLRVHMEQCTQVSHWVESREEGELLASRIKTWGYDGLFGCVWFLRQDEG